MTPQYRAMVYVAVATLHLYRGDIAALRGRYTVPVFRERNAKVLERVRKEVKNLFSYELSFEQESRAIEAYIAPSQKVATTKAATLT